MFLGKGAGPSSRRHSGDFRIRYSRVSPSTIYVFRGMSVLGDKAAIRR